MKLRFVVATRQSRQDFFTHTATGRSLALYRFPAAQLRLFPDNRTGLSSVYNIAIEESAKDPALLVFAHDDLHILDFNWLDRLALSLRRFRIVGIAGNKRRVARQPGWAFVDETFTWDKPENLSGIIGHGTTFPPSDLSIFGPPHQAVKLLDGLMFSCRSKTLIESGLRFDERFEFDFYDMDFCRQAEEKQLTMGTCALSVIHESSGNFGSARWYRAYQKYLEKWGS